VGNIVFSNATLATKPRAKEVKQDRASCLVSGQRLPSFLYLTWSYCVNAYLLLPNLPPRLSRFSLKESWGVVGERGWMDKIRSSNTLFFGLVPPSLSGCRVRAAQKRRQRTAKDKGRITSKMLWSAMATVGSIVASSKTWGRHESRLDTRGLGRNDPGFPSFVEARDVFDDVVQNSRIAMAQRPPNMTHAVEN